MRPSHFLRYRLKNAAFPCFLQLCFEKRRVSLHNRNSLVLWKALCLKNISSCAVDIFIERYKVFKTYTFTSAHNIRWLAIRQKALHRNCSSKGRMNAVPPFFHDSVWTHCISPWSDNGDNPEMLTEKRIQPLPVQHSSSKATFCRSFLGAASQPVGHLLWQGYLHTLLSHYCCNFLLPSIKANPQNVKSLF